METSIIKIKALKSSPKKFKTVKEKTKTKILNKIFLTHVKNIKVFEAKKNVNKGLYKKILGTLIKKGKKNFAKKALNHSLYITSRLYRIPSYKILPSILKNLKCHVEIKKVIRRKNITLIPFPLTRERQRFLKIK